MVTIFFVHQSADLYGSDKALLNLVQRLDRREFRPIVALPCDGPLVEVLRVEGVEVFIAPLVRVGRMSLSPRQLARLPFDLYHSLRAIDALIGNITIDVVHSNTLAVLSGALWAKKNRIPHLWHVHEIIGHPAFISHYYPWFVDASSSRVVANSQATLEWLVQEKAEIKSKSVCIWNGVERDVPSNTVKTTQFRAMLGLQVTDVLITLVGRINRWKGQRLLVKAADTLWKRGKRGLRYLIVGDAPHGQDDYKRDLMKDIDESLARVNFNVIDFCRDIWTVWDATDIAVVASTEPEPFGLVAVEAMAAGKPLIAAAHGGLQEIVINGETGLLFPPRNVDALADKIEQLSASSFLRYELGTRGRMRQQELFSMNRYISAFEREYRLLAQRPVE